MADARRCVFCQNALDSAEDRTLSGSAIRLTDQQIAQLPIQTQKSPKLPHDMQTPGQLTVPSWAAQAGIYVAGFVVVIVLLKFLVRC
jgi:hypothetical protein